MSYVLGVILGLSLINTIFLVNNLKTNTENKKQLDNLYNFTIHNIELTNYTIDKKTIYVISLASPIGKILNNKKEGDNIIFNNRSEKIQKII